MKHLFLSLALLCTTLSHAAQLTTVHSIEILAVDGKEVSSTLLGNTDITLSEGKHQIVTRYSNGFGNKDMLESNPYIYDITIKGDTKLDVIGGGNYNRMKKAIQTGITWKVINEDGALEIDNAQQLEGSGFMPFSDIEAVVAKHNKKHGIAVAATAAQTTAIAQADPAPSTAKSANSSNDLISLYQQASKEEKKQFRMWLLEQDMK